jgi:hypothetical protein
MTRHAVVVPRDGLRERSASVPYFLGFFRLPFLLALASAFALPMAFLAALRASSASVFR